MEENLFSSYTFPISVTETFKIMILFLVFLQFINNTCNFFIIETNFVHVRKTFCSCTFYCSGRDIVNFLFIGITNLITFSTLNLE